MSKAVALAVLLVLESCQYPLRTTTVAEERFYGTPLPPLTDYERISGISQLKQAMTAPIRAIEPLLPPQVPHGLHPKIYVRYDPGGLISEHEARWRLVGAGKSEVEILGMCQSACTMVFAGVPRERLCFGPDAWVNFHSARITAGGFPAPTSNRYMYNSYPQDIRDWIDSKGGWEALPLEGFWTLRAPNLWKMGYRKCE